MALAGTLAQGGFGLPDGTLEPFQQELEDGAETIGVHFGNVLERDLAAIEVFNHGHHGHTFSPSVVRVVDVSRPRYEGSSSALVWHRDLGAVHTS